MSRVFIAKINGGDGGSQPKPPSSQSSGSQPKPPSSQSSGSQPKPPSSQSSGSPVKPGPSPLGDIGKTSETGSGNSGILNFPKGYADAERLQFQEAGGWSPYTAPSSTDPEEAKRLETMTTTDQKTKEQGFKYHNDLSHEFFPGFTSDVHSSGNSQYSKDNKKLQDTLNNTTTGSLIGNMANVLSGGGMGALALLGGGLGGIMGMSGRREPIR